MAPKRGLQSKLPVPLPEGHVLKDLEGKEWKLGKKIGAGGFGLIYLAAPHVGRPVDDLSAVHVIKVEYHENGPLFSELKFYQRAAKPGNLKKWIGQKGLPYLGIPSYWGTGASEHNGRSYRFMVMDRLGSDLQKLILQRKLSKGFILQMGIRVLEVLEFMHENEYVHGDIKAANLMLGFRNPDEVYLADYGLSYRYCPGGIHKLYKDNPKKGHNGTIEFTSLDAHRGAAPSRRGDLEILGYCLLQWLCGQLPWEQNLADPAAVHAAKTKLLDELPNSVIKLTSHESTTREVAEFLTFVYQLNYDEKPKYEIFKRILSDGFGSSGASCTGLQNVSAAGGCSLVDLQVDCQNPGSKPVKLRIQNKTCEKKAKEKSGIKCHEAQEYTPVFTSEIYCMNETSETKVGLQKASSKAVKQCFRKKTCEEEVNVMMNGNYVKQGEAQKNKRLFVRDMSCKKETSRAKVYSNSESSYQCLRRPFLEAKESMHSEEDTEGNSSAYMFIHPQQNTQDCLFKGSSKPCILQPAISATAKAQMVAIVVILLIMFLLLYSDNVQMLLCRHTF